MEQMQQRLTPQQALPKAKIYCAYQERCHSEVKDKLYSFGLNKNEVEEIVSTLIEENFLNEERFAIMFAGGHFRSKQWGKIKIAHALKQKQVSPYCIKTALQHIDADDYQLTLKKLLERKFELLRAEKNKYTKKKKLLSYLLQRGFEMSLINETLAAADNC